MSGHFPDTGDEGASTGPERLGSSIVVWIAWWWWRLPVRWTR
jgi:hypothetical protein